MDSLTITTTDWSSFLTEGKSYHIVDSDEHRGEWIIIDDGGDNCRLEAGEEERGCWCFDKDAPVMVKIPKSMLLRARSIVNETS